jgi:FkbM family methyltransferase
MSTPPTPNPTFFSQHGEDILAWKVFGPRPRNSPSANGPNDPCGRFFVEVGMIDGVRFSNTLALERMGWRGLCVEAHPGFIDQVRANRPGSRVMHAAAADVSGPAMTFYADPRGDLSSLIRRDEKEMKARFGPWYQGVTAVSVPVRTLDEMLTEVNAPREFELLSIDIEGGEPAALKGLDLNKWRPRMMILEADDEQARRNLDALVEPAGYRCVRRVGVNAIYTRTTRDAWAVRLVRIDQCVRLTANPADADGQDRIVIPASFETRSQYARRLVRSLARAA